MTQRLFSIGATVAAVTLAAAFAIAQGADGPGQSDAPMVGQGPAPPPPGQVGRGRGPSPRIGPRGGRGAGLQGPARGPGRGFAALDLTEDQRAKVTDLQRATQDQAAPLRDELVFTRRTLHRELFADSRDNAAVASLTAKVATLQKQLADLRVTTTTAVADLLTPRQRETMRLMEGGRGGRGQGGPGRPGFARGRGGNRGPAPGSGNTR